MLGWQQPEAYALHLDGLLEGFRAHMLTSAGTARHHSPGHPMLCLEPRTMKVLGSRVSALLRRVHISNPSKEDLSAAFQPAFLMAEQGGHESDR